MERTATTKQVAAALGVKETTIQLYSRHGRIPFVTTPGGHRRYDISEVRFALGLDGDSAPLLTPFRSSGLGVGMTTKRSVLATMDVERRAVMGEIGAYTDSDTTAESATVSLIEHSRRVLVAV